MEEVSIVMSGHPVKKSLGIDRMHSEILRKSHKELIALLTRFLNSLLNVLSL